MSSASVADPIPHHFKRQPRLPTFAVPRRYALILTPDLDACTFIGAVEIDIDVIDPTPFLVLNYLDLVIGAVSVVLRISYHEIRPDHVVFDAEDEVLVLAFNEAIPVGKAVLAIGFSGVLNDHMMGFGRSKYEVDGIKRNMAVTQFEPVEARRCFPCWDEPRLHSRLHWKFQLIDALSNMSAANELVHGHQKTVYFVESPIMPTYLVAVVVGMFDYIEDLTPDGRALFLIVFSEILFDSDIFNHSGTNLCVYCQIGKSDQGKFGLQVAEVTRAV